MANNLGRSTGFAVFKARWQRLHREWHLDNSGRLGDDLAHRGAPQCLNHRLRANNEQPQRDSVAGNAYVEMLLVLPILIAVFLGLATVASLFLGKMAVSQAAEAGAQALASGQNQTAVARVVSNTLHQEGYQGTGFNTKETINGASDSVTVSLPYTLWNTGAATTLRAARTLTTVSGSGSSSGSSGGGGGGGIIYHHFPMW